MPIILVIVLIAGLCFGASLHSDVADADSTKEMTVAEYYASPKKSGFVRLSNGELSLLYGQLSTKRRKDTQEIISSIAYIPLLPADTIGSEPAKLLLASTDAADTSFLRGAMEAKDPKEFMKEKGAAAFRHIDHIAGHLQPPSTHLAEAAADQANLIAAGALVLEPATESGSNGDRIGSYIFFGIAGVALIFLGGWVVAPSLMEGAAAKKDARGIIGSANLSDAELLQSLHDGARLVVFQYTFSVLIMTFKRGSSLYFVKNRGRAIYLGLPYTFATLCAGWWGFPWGPIYSFASIGNNFMGGKDVTEAFLAHVGQSAAAPRTAKV